MHILLIENDEVYAAALVTELHAHGNEVAAVPGIRDALALIDTRAFDAIVLERVMPGMDGLTALRWLRGGNVTVPIVMLCPHGGLANTLAGLQSGADDYLVKPIEPAELDARLRALVRGRRWATLPPDTLRAGAIAVSPSRGRAWGNDTPLRLSELELRLLTQLLANAGTVMTRTTLVAAVWGYDTVPGANIVDVHVGKLRRKLVSQAGCDPIVTVRGVGYMIEGQAG